MNLASGLNTIHSLKYSHRDLKPENILVSLEGDFKISDFSSCTNRFYENINNHVIHNKKNAKEFVKIFYFSYLNSYRTETKLFSI